MPFANEHAARIKSPGQYVRFRRKNNHFKSGIHVIFGIKKNGSSEVQSIRFNKNKFTVAQAKKWLRDNNFKPLLFEPATGEGNIMFGEHEHDHYRGGHIMERQFVPMEDKAEGDRFQPRFRFTETALDRHGEVVVASGGDLRNWKANPQIFFGHSSFYAIGLGVPSTVNQTDKFIDSDLFFDDDGDDQFATMISLKVQKGFLKTSSIGFRSLKRTPPEEPVVKGQTGVAHVKWELYETSIVPIPALVKARRLKHGAIRDEFDVFRGQVKEFGFAGLDDDLRFWAEQGIVEDELAEYLGFGNKTSIVVPKQLADVLGSIDKRLTNIESALKAESIEAVLEETNGISNTSDRILADIDKMRGYLLNGDG